MTTLTREQPGGTGVESRRTPRADGSHTGRLPAAEARAMFQEFFLTRDPALRERLVTSHLGLAASLASRFGSRHESPDDLHQAALLGLLHAVDRYDPDRGVQFTTFAWATISGELKRHFRDRTWGVRVPRRVQELYLVTAEAMDALTNTLGRSPTVAEVAQRIGASEEDVVEALEARTAYRLTSIDAPVGNDESEGGMQLGDDDPGFGRVEERAIIGRLITRLPAREREIIQLRFAEELTQAEIAQRIGVSQMHVSRLLSASLAKLRAWADEREESRA
jgi:RNA polymerase sigma-B factor